MALRTSAAGYPGPHLGATLAECLWHLCHSSGLWSIALVEVSRNAQRSSPTLWLHGDYERRPAKSFLGSAWLVWLGSYNHQSQLHWSYGNTRRLKNIHSRTRSEWSDAHSPSETWKMTGPAMQRVVRHPAAASPSDQATRWLSSPLPQKPASRRPQS